MKLLAFVPELSLTATAVVGLLLGSFLPRRRQWVVRAIAAAACVAGLAGTGVAMTGPAGLVADGVYAVDTGLNVSRIVVLTATLLVVILSFDATHGHERETEFHVLTLLAAVGAVGLAGANDLLLLAAAYLLASVPLYALAGFRKDAPGTEAALKYYLMGALFGVVLLGGVTIVYGATGATGYPALRAAMEGAPPAAVAAGVVAVLAGLLFKIGAVPCHFWVPDVAQGASAPVAAFVTTVPKVGGLVAAFRLVTVALPASSADWALLLAVVAALTMTLGNLAAFFQRGPRRLLGYSSVSQVGYLLVAVAVAGRSDIAAQALLFYVAAYALTNLGAFAVAAEFPRARTLDEYAGLARRRPALALTLAVCLLGFIGTPPTGVFVGKLEVFAAAIDGGYAWLAVLAVVNTVASVFYYLRWLVPAFLRAPPHGSTELARAGRGAALAAYLAGVGSLALGLAAGTVLPPAHAALFVV